MEKFGRKKKEENYTQFNISAKPHTCISQNQKMGGGDNVGSKQSTRFKELYKQEVYSRPIVQYIRDGRLLKLKTQSIIIWRMIIKIPNSNKTY